MKEFLVSFVIVSPSMILAEISRWMGTAACSTSIEKGSLCWNKSRWKQTIWRLESTAGKQASLAEHLQSLFRLLPRRILQKAVKLGDGHHVYIRIGVLYDTLTCGIVIPSEFIRRIGNRGIELELCTYPTSFTKARKTPRRSKKANSPIKALAQS
jgi:hypothetical protein